MGGSQQIMDLNSTVSQAIDALTKFDCDSLEEIASTCDSWSCAADARTLCEASQGLVPGTGKLQILAGLLALSGANMRLLRRVDRNNSVGPEYVSDSGNWKSGALD
jgi:hypothetical protein